MQHNGGNHNGQTIALELANLVAADGSVGGFLKDSQLASAANAKDTTNSTSVLTPANMIDIGAMRLLFVLLSADLNTTADQSFTKVGVFTNYTIFAILPNNSSGNVTTAAGGIYTGASKSGGIIVASTQNYAAMSASGGGTACTVAAGGANSGRAVNSATPILSLTTPQGSAMTCDIYILGFVLS